MYSQILVPLDGSKLAEKAIPHAEGLAKTSKATVHLLRVMERHGEGVNPTEDTGLAPLEISKRNLELARQLEEAELAGAEEYLEHIGNRLKNEGIIVQTQLTEGHVDDRIVDYAKNHGIDLVVMCTHGRGGLRRLFVGSVTDRVVRAGEIPVLVVPSH
ncbi:MAG: universal stress protein [Ardenticatenaceae bacterium]